MLSCKQNSSLESASDTVATPTVKPKTSVKIVTLYSGLSNPWGMTWLPDGRLLVTEK
ncbi:MAG: Glucose/arabinose dehydrogenase, beta-propeller fold, partial [Daejeonella sp.]|nr:Glucose/arabinose dehydrogenase, beta-propeller fold [Daejeonella sp.]